MALAGQNLDEPQFLDIPGNGGLGDLEPLFAQEPSQLLLGLHVLRSDDLDDHGMSFRLHSFRLVR